MPKDIKLQCPIVKAGVDVWKLTQNLGINTRILNYLVHLKQTKPYPDETLRVIQWTLTRISKNADLSKPDQVNNYIASLQRSNNYKLKRARFFVSRRFRVVVVLKDRSIALLVDADDALGKCNPLVRTSGVVALVSIVVGVLLHLLSTTGTIQSIPSQLRKIAFMQR